MLRNLRCVSFMLFSAILPCSFIFGQKNPQEIKTAKTQILSDKKVFSVEFSEERQTPSIIIMNIKNGSYPKMTASDLLKKYVELRTGIDGLRATRNSTLKNSMEIDEFQQYFKGIKVEHGNYKALIKNDNIEFFNGAWFNVPSSLSTQPAITEAQALGYAKSSIKANKYAWEEVEELLQHTTNLQQRQTLENELNEYLPKGELVVVKDFTKSGIAVMRLAYKFNIYAAEPLSRGWVYVDAENGNILLYDSILKDFDEKKNNPPSTDATVTTRYAGTQTIKVKQISGNDPNSGNMLISSHPTTEVYVPGALTYVLMDDTRGNGIETYDLNGVGGLPISVAGIYTQGKSFTDADNNWTFAEHHRSAGNDGAMEAENDDIAWDAHWGAETVYDYWINKHNRLSFDGNNGKIKSFIHYGPAYDNAFWNGSVMTYGDGSGPTATGFKALTSLDVCGHEIGHGVCSSTSDLVYASESGGMNEALSDIWASCIEHFAMTRAGSTVPPGIYRPFYIGEQIGADYDSPLRRMDNPKQQGNPDTYGGTNWVNPVCSPNLVNDECGVHTNSGILNKWFFLITAGSQNGTRGIGTASYYFPDSDDEINDLGNTYSVNGLGFDVSENITFLTEFLLSASATYAEARDVSIAVAKALTGNPCDPLVETVTNAWYAVGVGTAFITPCVVTYGFTFQPGFTLSESALGTGCNDGKTFFVPVLLPANSTASFTAGGTATVGLDYTLGATSIDNLTGSIKQDTLSVFVKNDAVVENNETIDLTVSVTNTGGNPVNTNYVITITDDDVIPVIGADSITLLSETFTRTDGFADPAGWTEIMEIPEGTFSLPGNPTPNGKNQWGIFNNQLAVTGKVFVTDAAFPSGTYNNLSESRSIIRSSQLDARGLNTVVIHFDYTVQGEVDLTSGSTDPEDLPIFDYMGIVYSFDAVNFTELNTGAYKIFASGTPSSGTYNIALPAALNNKQFYLGFRWYNDGNAGGPVSVDIDNLTLKALPRKIENDLGNSGNENFNANQEIYIYSQNDGQLIAKVNNGSSHDYGCTTASIEKAGTGGFELYSDATYKHRVADKIIRITPATNNASGTYTITLYYTEQQIAALEAYTSLSRTNFYIYKTSASSYTGATSANTERTAATYTAMPGVGGSFTASFSTGFSGFALGAAVSVILPVSCIDFKATKINNAGHLQWKVTNENDSRSFEVERSTDGYTYTSIGTVHIDPQNAGNYSFDDNNTAGLQVAYYRLKQSDINGSYRYLCSVLMLRFDGKAFSIGNIYPNPGKTDARVNIYSDRPMQLRIEYVNATGQLINIQTEQIQPGSASLQLKLNAIGAGTYMVRFKDENGIILSSQTYMRL